MIAHVGAAPPPALLDHVGRGVVDAHERDRPGGDPARGLHDVALRPQPREREPRAPARLVDQRHVLERLEDARHRVLDRQHEARGKLAELGPGVHQRRGVRQELQRAHRGVELIGGALRRRHDGS